MPQTIVAVQCAFCHAFQGTLDKKNKKFGCAVCGQKQSYRQVHAISNSGKDIRKVVQELNELRGAHEQAAGQMDPKQHVCQEQASCRDQQQRLEWGNFAETAVEQNYDDDDAGPYVTTIPDSVVRGKGRQLEKPRNKRRKLQEQDGEVQQPSSSNNMARAFGLSVDNLHRGSPKAASTVSKNVMQQQQQQQQRQQLQLAVRAQGLLQMPASAGEPWHTSVLDQQPSQQHQQHCGGKARHQQQQPWTGTGTSGQHYSYAQQKPVSQYHHHRQQQPQAAGSHAAGAVKQQPQMPLMQQQMDGYRELESWAPREQLQHNHHHQQQQQLSCPCRNLPQQQLWQQQPHSLQPAGIPPKPPARQLPRISKVSSLSQQHHTPAAASNHAWGGFVDEDMPVYSSDEEAEGGVDEQGYCRGIPLASIGYAVETTTSRALSKWG